MSWSDGNDYCAANYGTTLATVTNDEEAVELKEIVDALSAHSWIGLSDIEDEGTWKWVSGWECEGNCADLDWWFESYLDGSGDCAIAYDNVAVDRLFDDTNCASLFTIVCDGYAPGATPCDADGVHAVNWHDLVHCMHSEHDSSLYFLALPPLSS